MKRPSFAGLRYAASGGLWGNIKYGTCQFGSFLRKGKSPFALPTLPYPAPVFSATASSATVADALISLANVTSRPRHAFGTWHFLRYLSRVLLLPPVTKFPSKVWYFLTDWLLETLQNPRGGVTQRLPRTPVPLLLPLADQGETLSK